MKRSDIAIDWIESHLYVPDGLLVGQKIKLLPFQKEFIRKIYDNPHGTRTAILSIPRKNGKTGLIACLLLLHLVGPFAVPNSNLYSAAQSRDQAAITFDAAMKMVRMSPSLLSVVKIRDTAKELIVPELGTVYKALSAEASTAFGLKPVLIIHDELGQVEGEKFDLYDALETATATQANPLTLIISTQAPNDAALLSQLIDDALEGNDKRTVATVYTVPPDKDPFDRNELAKANPALGVFQNAEELFGQMEAARRMPAREAAFRNLQANQRVEARSPFISRSLWESCKGEVVDFTGRPVYVGLDLSSVKDLTALVGITNVSGKWHVKGIAWLPDDNLDERSKADRVPYVAWRDAGYLRTIPGRSIDYADLADDIAEIFKEWNIKGVGFDRWHFEHLQPRLKDSGMPDYEINKFIPFGQGTKSMSPALRELESAILDGRLVHDGNPVFNWCMSNAVVTGKNESNRRLDKEKSRGRIDLAVALAMAFGITGQQKIEDYTGKILVSNW